VKIHVVPFAGAINRKLIQNKTVVVIDVLRATSVMTTALYHGAKQIIPCLTVEEAFKRSETYAEDSCLLCGERDARKIKGFDLGNSPLEFTPEIVKGKTIFLTTTNGTKALRSGSDAKEILIGAFLNLNAVTKKILEREKLVLVCSGTNDKFSLDDGMCAGAIINELSKQTEIKIDDLGEVLLKTWRSENGNLNQMLKNCFHLNYLKDKGYAEDVDYCLQINRIPVVSEFRDNFSVIIP
jgi:2-phosphosulfolactate phosphatase